MHFSAFPNRADRVTKTKKKRYGILIQSSTFLNFPTFQEQRSLWKSEVRSQKSEITNTELVQNTRTGEISNLPTSTIKKLLTSKEIAYIEKKSSNPIV